MNKNAKLSTDKQKKTFAQGARCSTNDEATSSVEVVETADGNFERELLWCIEQLQLGLETQKPDTKQAKEATKILNILVSSKAPIIKKRQAMRTTFGDYRKKMSDEEKKSTAAVKKGKVTMVDLSSLQKSQFFKRSARQCCKDGDAENATSSRFQKSLEKDQMTTFKFNFDIDAANVNEDTKT